MLYLSQILGSRVEDSADEVVGRLQDILVLSQSGVYSPLFFLLVKTKKKSETILVPYEYVENLSRQTIDLKVPFNKIALGSSDVGQTYINRDVLDQQIVDVGGARVVRVNDLALGMFEDAMCVLGVDVSFKGILRRLGFPGLDSLGWLKAHLIDWRKTQPIKGTLKLDTISKDLTKLHPADLANIVEDLSVKHGRKLVRSLDSRAAAKVIEELEPRLQKILINYLGPEKAAGIIEKMSVEEIADLMQLFPRAEAQQFLSFLQNGKLKKVQRLIGYKEDTAGGLMSTDFVSAEPDWTVERAIEEVKSASPAMRSIIFIYVTDEDGKFLGPVSVRNLLVADKDILLKELMKPVELLHTLKPSDDIDGVVNMMTKYDLFSAVVLDAGGKLIGVVSIDDVMRCLAPKA